MAKNGLFIYNSGDKFYYQSGKLSRSNGPAVIYAFGQKEWLLEGKRHRLEGPSIYGSRKYKAMWYINGEYIDCKDQETFERIVKLLVFS